jgi:tRNA(fMet)-specific endonuclease VapC
MEIKALLLDTSAYSAFMKGHLDIKLALQQTDEIYLSPIVLGELLSGFRRGKYRKKNEEELAVFLSSPRVRTLRIDDGTAERYAVILNSIWTAGTPIPTNDLWIAASAMQHGLHLLTTDTHYMKVPQIIIDFFPGS